MSTISNTIPAPPPDIDMTKAGWLGWFNAVVAFACGIYILNCVTYHDTIAIAAKSGNDNMVLGAQVIYLWSLVECSFFWIVGIITLFQLNRRSPTPIALRWVAWLLIGKAVLALPDFWLSPDMQSFKAIGSSIIWLLYFYESKRVRLTFGRNLFRRNDVQAEVSK